MSNVTSNSNTVWRMSPITWATVISLLAVLPLIYYDALMHMVHYWETTEEYSHGYLIPFISLFLIWQKKDQLELIPFSGSWSGLAAILFGALLYVAGVLSSLFVIIEYSFIIVLAGLALTFMGWRGFKIILVPLLILVFMIPLPNFIFNNLSAQLQLLSSDIGVAVIRLFGISVFLEGNVIDLGSFKLQVVEACSGLRYLFPMMTLAFIAAYFFKTKFWKRAVIFLSSIPITIFMNSFRIGIIGVTSEYWGKSAAEGFLHDFEGWAIFMVCTGVLIAEMWILARIGKDRRPLHEIFGLELPAPTPKDVARQSRTLPGSYMSAIVVIAALAVLSVLLPQRVEAIPKRENFANFPLNIGEWRGKRERLEQIYIDALKFDDYVFVNFLDRDQHFVNFYSAYYASQRAGESAHSPRTCIPGGGWEISDFSQHVLAAKTPAGKQLVVNRVVIRKGDYRQLVYYWFQQRGRFITNEYLVKWYMFWDSLTRNRTDGALVRLTTTLEPGQKLEESDARLSAFATMIAPQLGIYIPE